MISGLVDRPFTLSWDEFVALPRKTVQCDIHCVTTWSRLDNAFEGVPVQALLQRAGITPEFLKGLTPDERSYYGVDKNMQPTGFLVDAGSFAASTLNIKDADFLAGRYTFSGNGGSARVSNAGRINVSDGGFAALLGGQVSNSGVISGRNTPS